MNIRVVGLGKLAAPIFTEVAKTHMVFGYDVNESRRDTCPGIAWAPTDPIYQQPTVDLCFVAVQTPHGPEYEGVTRLPRDRADFDYSHLIQAVTDLAESGPKRPPLIIVSTVLPGTIEREIVPLWKNQDGSQAPVVYHPFFIAMGTEVADFLDPEFILLGLPADDNADRAIDLLLDFYSALGVNVCLTEIVEYREAELAKMAYNTFIGLKIAFANTIGEMCHRLGINADAVLDVVKSGHRRIISDSYLDPGMGDGGPCHPRDNIALSWLARETEMSFDLFGAVMEQREAHTGWLADLVQDVAYDETPGDRYSWRQHLPVTVLGRSYKPGTTLETGSAGILLSNILHERGVEHDHVADLEDNGIGWVGDGFDI